MKKTKKLKAGQPILFWSNKDNEWGLVEGRVVFDHDGGSDVVFVSRGRGTGTEFVQEKWTSIDGEDKLAARVLESMAEGIDERTRKIDALEDEIVKIIDQMLGLHGRLKSGKKSKPTKRKGRE